MDASDVVQHALLQAHESREQFRGRTELFLEHLGHNGREKMDKLLRSLPGGSECEQRACMAEAPRAAKVAARSSS